MQKQSFVLAHYPVEAKAFLDGYAAPYFTARGQLEPEKIAA